MNISVVEKMKRVGDKAYFLLSNGDKFGHKIMDIGHDTNPNGTHRGMLIDGKLLPTTVTEMILVNIWKNMLQGKQLG